MNTAETFDEAAGDFAVLAPRLWDPLGRELVARAAPKPGERVLDVCCGAGASALPAARAVGAAGRVDAVDLSARLLDLGREAARGLPQLRFWRGDAAAWQPDEGPYDLVQSAYGMFFLPDMDAGARHLIGLLRRGSGRFAVQTWRHGALAEFAQCMIDAITAERQLTVGTPPVASASERIDTGDKLTGWLTSLGLADVRVSEVPYTRPLTGDLAWDLVRGTGWRHLLTGVDDTAQLRIRDRLIRRLATRGITDLDAGSLTGIGVRP